MPTTPFTRRSRAAGWWTGALVLALAAMTVSFGSPPGIPANAATGFLPPDGHRVRFTGPTGALATEWAIDQSGQLINPGPRHFGYWLGKAGLSYTDTVAARQTTVFTNSAGVVVNREDTFMTAGPDGVGTGVEVRSWTDSRLYFPARLDLPTTVAAGRSWTSQGDAEIFTKTGQTQQSTYRAQYQAAAATDAPRAGCLDITMTLQVGSVNEPAVTRTWCPRLGVTKIVETDGTWRPADAGNATIAAPATTAFDGDAAAQLSFSSHTINQASVPGSILAAPISAPAVLDDGTVVVVQKQFRDTVGLSTAAEPVASVWRARPGGTASTTATFGDLTVVATSRRQLVAYDRFGRWVWQAPLPDQAVATPARMGDLVVVASLDGSITAIDLTNGSVSWTRRVGDAVRLAPQTLNDRVVVADLGNHLTCFDVNGTQLWTRDSLSVNGFVIAPGAEPVVVVGGGYQATGISVADGSTVWQNALRLSFSSMVALRGVVAVQDGNLTLGIDATSGTTLWRWDQERTYGSVGGENRLFLLTANRLICLDARGQLVKDWTLPMTNSASTSVLLSLGTDRLVIWTDHGVLLGVIG